MMRISVAEGAMFRFNADFNFFRPGYWFGQIDSRPLSLFRILFALILLKDAIYRVALADVFYSDAGIFRRDVLLEIAREHRFSLMDSFSAGWMAALFFIAWIVVLLGLLVGYRTRWMVLLNFVFLLSVHERNIYVLNGADTVLRVMAFWALFVPLSDYYSLDAVRKRWQQFRETGNEADLRAADKPHLTFAFPVRMFQLQIAMIYLFTFWQKVPGDEWRNGEALFYALQLQSLTLPTGDWMVTHLPFELLQVMSLGAFVIEGAFLFLVFAPLLQPVLRILGLVSGAMLHVGIALLMSIPNFSAVMLASYTLFVLPGWIAAIENSLRRPKEQLALPRPLADSPLWLLLAITRPERVALLGGDNHAERDGWFIYDAQQNRHTGIEAWCLLGGSWFRYGWLRELVWRIGQSLMVVRRPRPMPMASTITRRVVTSVLLGVLMFNVIQWNLATVKINDEPVSEKVEGHARAAVQLVGLWQGWGMFAPYPSKVDGWIVVPGVFEDGTSYNLMDGEEVNTAQMQRWYFGPDARWKKFTSNLYRRSYPDLLQAWASYYCRTFNEDRREGERLATLEIHAYTRRSYAPGEAENHYSPRTLWRHWCYPEYKY